MSELYTAKMDKFKEKIITKVIEQIREDIDSGEYDGVDCIAGLLVHLQKRILLDFLMEDDANLLITQQKKGE